LGAKGFTIGTVGNNDRAKVTESQVQAPAEGDQGAQAVAAELGGLPIVVDSAVAPGTVRVVLTEDYTGPGSGLDGTLPSGAVPTGATIDKSAQDIAGDTSADSLADQAPLPSQVFTAGAADPKCVN
jgi:hypothetical protein